MAWCLERHQKIGKLRWLSHTRETEQVRMHQLPVFLSLTSLEKCMSSTLPKDAAKWLKQNWRMPSAVFVLAVALQTNLSFSNKRSRNLGSMPCQRCLLMFCRCRESIRAGPSWKALGSAAGVRCWWPPVTSRQVTVFLLRCFVSVSVELNHNHLPKVLDSDRDVCCHHSSS